MSISLTEESRSTSEWFDLWGTWLSAACVLHCLAAPLILLLVPVQMASWIWSPATHAVVAVFTVLLVVAAVLPSWSEHRHPAIPFLATLGCGFILLGMLWPCAGVCHGGPSTWQQFVTMRNFWTAETFASLWTPFGALSLVVMHLFNVRLRRQAVCC